MGGVACVGGGLPRVLGGTGTSLPRVVLENDAMGKGHRLVTLAAAPYFLAVGCSSLTPINFTSIRIVELATGRNLADVGVVIHASNPANSWFDEWEASVAPTDSDGRTLIPLEAFEEDAPGIKLQVTIEHEGTTETLELLNRNGRQAEGELFSATVLDTNAPLPAPPDLEIVEGTNPIQIRVDGYIQTLEVCSNATGLVVWRISTDYSDWHPYLGTVGLGVIPDGWGDDTARDVWRNGFYVPEPRTCRTNLSGDELPTDGYTVVATMLEYDHAVSDCFCLDEEARAIACPEP